MSTRSIGRRSLLRMSGTLALGAAMSPLLQACGPTTSTSTAAPSGSQTPAPAQSDLNYTLWYVDTSENKLFLDPRVASFAAKFPQYKFHLTWSAPPSVAEKMLPAMLAGQKEPSTGGLVVFDFPKFLKGNTAQNGLHDLRQFLTKSDLDNLLMKENWSYKGAYYGIPNANTVSMYWYNKKILDDAKIDPTTFKLYGDFIDAGLKLKRDKGIYMTFLDVASWNHFLTLARQNGGGTFDKDGNPIIDSPANLEALQLWYDMLKKHGIAMPTTSFFGAGTYEAYKRREVAGMIMADWWLKFSLAPSVPEQSGEWYGAALPRFKAGGLRTAHRGGTAFVVQKNVERPDILVEFLKYLYMTTDGWVEKMRAAAQVPSWVPAFDTPEIKNYKEPFLGGQQPMSLYSELSKEVPPDYTGPFETEALTLISQKVIPAVFGGEKSPAQALRDAQTSIKQTIAAG